MDSIPCNGQLFSAEDFGDFGAAVSEKLGREITPIPAPGRMLLLGSGLEAFALRRRRHSPS